MFWKRKPKPWRPVLVQDIERWLTDPHSSDDKVVEGVRLSMRVLATALEMAVFRQQYMIRALQQIPFPARERLDGDG